MRPMLDLRIFCVLALSIVGCQLELPSDVNISAEVPLRVNRDDDFVVLAGVTNTGDESRTLVDLDVADSTLEGIVIQRTEPPFSDAMHVPIDNTQSYSFDLPIAPGEEVVVRFHAVAAHKGDFAGDIDFCVDSETSCGSYPLRTIVE